MNISFFRLPWAWKDGKGSPERQCVSSNELSCILSSSWWSGNIQLHKTYNTFQYSGCFLLRHVTFIPFARISLGISYNFVRCNNRNLDFTVFDQNYVCSHRLVTILTDVPDVSVWTFKVNEGPVVEYQPAISENYVTVSVLIREWLWIYRTCGLKVLQD